MIGGRNGFGHAYPPGHVLHSALLAFTDHIPSGQLRHADFPTPSWYNPGPQGSGEDMDGDGHRKPFGHGKQADGWPPGLYNPTAQAVSLRVPGSHQTPDGHGWQDSWPPMANIPGVQGTGGVSVRAQAMSLGHTQHTELCPRL
jgi:hypothetical protein